MDIEAPTELSFLLEGVGLSIRDVAGRTESAAESIPVLFAAQILGNAPVC
jgi:hypothetical protein